MRCMVTVLGRCVCGDDARQVWVTMPGRCEWWRCQAGVGGR